MSGCIVPIKNPEQELLHLRRPPVTIALGRNKPARGEHLCQRGKAGPLALPSDQAFTELAVGPVDLGPIAFHRGMVPRRSSQRGQHGHLIFERISRRQQPSGPQHGGRMPFYIGKISGGLCGSRQLNGLVDDVRVYNRALSAQELQSIFTAGPTL